MAPESHNGSTRSRWLRRIGIWLAGALALAIAGFLCGAHVVGRVFVRSALMQETKAEMIDVLQAPADLGVPSGKQLVQLLENERAEVRQAAAFVILFDTKRVTPAMIEPYYRDPDAKVRILCLMTGAQLGERDCVLALDELLRSSALDSKAYHVSARALVLGGFREAGDDIVRRFDTTTDERTRLLLVGRLQRLLREKGFVGDRGVLIEGEYVRCAGLHTGMEREKLERLFKELSRIWGLVKKEYRSVQDFRSRDRLGGRLPELEAFGVGRRFVCLFVLGLVGLWSLVFWGPVVMRPAMARFRSRR